MKCVILQPSYIPWRGYFHLIQKADIFVFYDDVQYDKHGWRNRNRIKSPTGSIWLTIPVLSRAVQEDSIAIKNIQFAPDTRWREKHLRSIQQCYAKAPYLKTYTPLLQEIYSDKSEHLADFTIGTTVMLARMLGLNATRFVRSSTLPHTGEKTDRLISLLQHLGATHYISGPAAKTYIEPEKFSAAGIRLEYMNYSYSPYPQLHGAFDPQLSVLDLLFMTGPDAPRHIWGTL